MNSFAALSIDTIPQRHESDSFAITLAPLSVEEIYALADDPANGAVVMMSGTVRNQTDGQAVVSLEYQAYEPMAVRVFQQIATEIRRQWALSIGSPFTTASDTCRWGKSAYWWLLAVPTGGRPLQLASTP
jgi:hypothetical protein